MLRPINVEKLEKLRLKDCDVEFNTVFRYDVDTKPSKLADETNPDRWSPSVVETRDAVEI